VGNIINRNKWRVTLINAIIHDLVTSQVVGIRTVIVNTFLVKGILIFGR
jgi:hypothetical protein